MKSTELTNAKARALYWLLSAAIIFIISLFPFSFLSPSFSWVHVLIRAMAEAALVGGLADWFAVHVLFHPLKVGRLDILRSHTAVIPRNKDNIADKLANFVTHHFLNKEVLIPLIQSNNPAGKLSGWLRQKENTDLLGKYCVKIMQRGLTTVDDAQIKAFIRESLVHSLKKIDLSNTAGNLLDAVIQNKKHQAVFEDVIGNVQNWLRTKDAKAWISDKVQNWLKNEHSYINTVLPTEKIGNKVAEIATNKFNDFLGEVLTTDSAQLRDKFDKAMQTLVDKLKHDPEWRIKSQELIAYLTEDKNFLAFVDSSWSGIKSWLNADLESDKSIIAIKVAEVGAWLGLSLAENPELITSFNTAIEELIADFTPELQLFVSGHIRSTIKKWDAAAMANELENSIGSELQSIRINGTGLGAILGMVLFGVTQLSHLLGG